MSIKKFAVAVYDDEAVLFPAVKKVRSAGYKIHDVYTPFAVHGLDVALGEKESDLHVSRASFMESPEQHSPRFYGLDFYHRLATKFWR
jgi:hypothetical protein